jgi:hypothetical protein
MVALVYALILSIIGARLSYLFTHPSAPALPRASLWCTACLCVAGAPGSTLHTSRDGNDISD